MKGLYPLYTHIYRKFEQDIKILEKRGKIRNQEITIFIYEYGGEN